MDRVETRELTYFVTVAEELHFGRAAERLGIAQPPLSRAIKRLERRLGVALLDRGSRHVALTPAGEVLLHEGSRALDAVAAAALRTRRAGQPDPRLVVATKPGGDAGLLPDILAAYEREPDAIPVDVHLCGVGEQMSLLRDGRADAAFLHAPHDDLSGIDTEELLVQRQVAVLPAWHRLAGRDGVRLADLEGETMPRWPGMAADAASGPEVRDAGQLMQLIVLGHTIAVLPESAVGHVRRDLVCVPVLDAPLVTMMVGWLEQSRSRALAAFVRAAAAVANRHQPVMAQG
ncbi:MAG: LysR family transcriptional regulator [Streptosporangiaceae bacterium]